MGFPNFLFDYWRVYHDIMIYLDEQRPWTYVIEIRHDMCCGQNMAYGCLWFLCFLVIDPILEIQTYWAVRSLLTDWCPSPKIGMQSIHVVLLKDRGQLHPQLNGTLPGFHPFPVLKKCWDRWHHPLIRFGIVWGYPAVTTDVECVNHVWTMGIDMI